VGKRQFERLERANRELQSAHAQLRHSDRLAYLGRIAAGVAHEIGNPLGAIYGYLEILRDLDLADADREVLDRLGKEIERIDRTMRGLLDFSRVKPAEPVPLDLPAAARETIELMKRQRGLDQVDVRVGATGRLPPATLDPTQLRQMLLNILLNAADAMSGRGEIRLDADAAPYNRADLMEARLPGAPSEEEAPFTDLTRRGIVFSEPYGPAPGALTVRLHVTDSGPGMSADVLGKLFDPFFTTKPPGKGTGLGLALCREMAAAAGGLIRVESRPDIGTCVSLIFPAAEGHEQAG
jgi:signal transduction histidine kinase